MTSTFTILFQILATLIQVLNAVNVAQLPAKWQPIVTAVLTIAQAVQGMLAHFYTPSGNKLSKAN